VLEISTQTCFPPDPNVTDPLQRERLAGFCKALAHPARISILMHLKALKQCICGQIVNTLPLAQSTVSQHLKMLKDAGLIQGETEGPRTCYCLNPDALEELKALINQL
jgi:DNA-binding transcriptional ArsR family regulator